MNAVVEMKQESRAVATTPAEMLFMAVQQGADMEKLSKLMDLQERWEKNEARKAFTAAMAAFKANPPEILKDKHVAYAKKDGSVTEYDHATLGGICAAIVKGLADNSISHRWDVKQEQKICVTCVLTHALGHSESVSMSSAPDESGGKNSIQAIASAVSYLQRYTLLAAVGLAAMDMDDDGKNALGGPPKITEQQAADLQAKMEEVGANKENFLKFLKVERLADLPASKFNAAIQALNDKAKGAR